MKIIITLFSVISSIVGLLLAVASLAAGVISVGLLIDVALAEVYRSPSDVIFVEVSSLQDAALVLVSAGTALLLAQLFSRFSVSTVSTNASSLSDGE